MTEVDTERRMPSESMYTTVAAPMEWKSDAAGRTFTFDLTKVPVEARAKIARGLIWQGFAVIMQRESAGEKDVKKANEARDARIAAWYRGDWAERGGAKLDPVLVELRLIAAKTGFKAEAARKATESELLAVWGEKKFAAYKQHAEGIVALRAELPELPEPDVAA